MKVRLITMFLLLGLAACAADRDWAGNGPAARTIYVFSNGWHSDIIVSRADLPPGHIPESADFAGNRFIMFGWGDRDYYMTSEPDLWITLKAALWPTASVMYLVGFNLHPADAFPHAEVIELTLNEAAFARLVAHLERSFQPGGAIAPGLYDDSFFYAGRGRFHLFNTCNRRTARGLKAAGLPVVSFGVITAGDVMRQLRALERDLGSQPGYNNAVAPVE